MLRATLRPTLLASCGVPTRLCTFITARPTVRAAPLTPTIAARPTARSTRLCASIAAHSTARSRPAARGLASEAAKKKHPVLAWCESNPVTLGVGVATWKTQAADLLTQTALEGKSLAEVDWRRNALFAVFGFAYMGCFQYYLYVTLFSRWFAGAARFANQPLAQKLTDRAGQLDLLKQVGFDTLVHPQWFFPIYYALKEALNGTPNVFDADDKLGVARAGVAKYYANNFAWFFEPAAAEGARPPPGSAEAEPLSDFVAFWKIWLVGDMVVYGLCPMWARLPANHVFSFVYVCVLSFMRGASTPEAPEH